MSLEQLKEELKEQIAEAQKREAGEGEEVEEVKEDEAKEEVVEEKEEEKPAEEEKKEEVKEEPKVESPDAAAFQRMRRENAAAKKRAEELEERLAVATKPKETEAEEIALPVVDPEIEEIKRSHNMSKAEREFNNLETAYKRNNPDYANVAAEYAAAIAQSIKIQNPRMDNDTLWEETKKTILVKAANYMKDGYDPIEEMHHEAKELGFTGKSMLRKEEKKEVAEEIKPDLKKLSANRSKSSGMTGAGGKSSDQAVTRAYIEQNGMPTNAEWAKMKPAEKKALLYGQ